MKRLHALLFCVALALQFVAPIFLASPALAIDPIDQIQSEIDQLNHLKDLSVAATTPLEKDVTDLQNRITKAKNDIAAAQAQTLQLADDIQKQELQLGGEYQIFTDRVDAEYKRSFLSSPLLTLLSSGDAANLTRTMAYRASVESRDNALIHQTGTEITNLETEKQNLADRQKRLAAMSADLTKQESFFSTEIAKAKNYQDQLSSQIASLTAQQQAILDARSGAFITSVGDVPPADDFNASIGFKPQAPSNSFAMFSFGAYTHRNGLSQYGAKARADAGQSAEDILQAYYPGSHLVKNYNEMGSISVSGYGRMSFEDQYLKGISEMPKDWNINALRAQAVAARTFAIRYTGNGGGTICTTEACQVFNGSNRGGGWEQAVNDTRNWVLVDGGGNPISTQYASTDGGYTNTAGWDTTDHSGSGDWSTNAWESKAHSPWFYKAWYTQGYSVNSAKCGRSNPWISQQEFSDIINAWLVRKNPNGADVNRILPVTMNSCGVGGGGGNPYSMDDLRNLANNSGGAVTNVSSVSVSNNSSAETTTVHLQTNRGEIDIPGTEFKQTFNLRAPGYLSIPQKSFAFFNIEYKP